MNGTTEQVIGEHYEDLRREGARVRPAPIARANRARQPYVVRDLSWEFARYLDTEEFSTGASVTSNGAS